MSDPHSIDLDSKPIVQDETLHCKVMVMPSSHFIIFLSKANDTFPKGHDSNEVSILSMNSFQVTNQFQSSYHDMIEAWLEESFKEILPMYVMHFLLLFVNRDSNGLILSIFNNKLF